MVSQETWDCGNKFFYTLKPFLQTANKSSYNIKTQSRGNVFNLHTPILAVTFYVNPG